MALEMRTHLMTSMAELRFDRRPQRVRVRHDGHTICDTTRAVLVWEPRRLVPVYAVPEESLEADLAPAGEPVRSAPADLPPLMGPDDFGTHTCLGQSLDVLVGDAVLHGAAFRADDKDLDGYVLLDFPAFDWLEEDQPAVGHPHDPFKRIDTLRSSRRVVVALGGVVLADTRSAVALLETHLPTRWYIPRRDVEMDRLEESEHRSTCAYKGHASYFSVRGSGVAGRAIAWTYPEPLHDAGPVRDMVCFFNERTDITVDGELARRPVTPWSTPQEQRALFETDRGLSSAEFG